MTDSADIKSAKLALSNAVDSLEAGLSDLMKRMQSLEASANDSESFREDRTKLAGQLDEMAAAAEAAKTRLASREAEFIKITQDSEAELDRVMGAVRGALERSQRV